MYYAFRTTFLTWHNQTLYARIQGDRPNYPEYEPHWWDAVPLVKPFPLLTFEINAKAPKPDNYETGTILDLYSERLIGIIRDAGVRFETFPVRIVDSKTGEALSLPYKLFHLLEMFPAIDMDLSEIHGRTRTIRKIVLTKSCMQTKRLLFRTKELSFLALIHQDLKEIFDSVGITGCRYIPIEEFKVR